LAAKLLPLVFFELRSIHDSAGVTPLSIEKLLRQPVAETTNGLYKAELIYRLGNWRNAIHVEMETLNYVNWFNSERIHEFCDDMSPQNFEMRSAPKRLTKS
jgi:putative transposase